MIVYHPDQPPEEIQPEFKFRGGWAHPDLFHLLAEGVITTTEFVLVLHVDALVDAKGEGCWASNSYLGKILRVTPLHVSKMVRHLKEIGVLVVKKGRRNVRYLEAFWSRLKRDTSEGGQLEQVCFKANPSLALKHTPSYRSFNYGSNTLAASAPAADAASRSTASRERENTPSLVVNTAQRENFLGVSPNQNTTCADRHVGWAKALRESFRANNITVTNQRAVSSWAKEFQRLELAVGEAALAEVLAWYIPRVGKKFVPVAHSGKSFRVKFPQIKLAMERDKRDNPEVVLTAEMKALADNLVRDYRWPKGSDKLVHEAVARSWTALAAFRKKLLPLFESGTKTNAPQHAQFAAKCVRHELIIDSFVQRWMKNLHAELVKWEQWSGSRQSFLNRAVDTDGDAFHKWGRGLAAKWGNSKIWDKLMEEVK